MHIRTRVSAALVATLVGALAGLAACGERPDPDGVVRIAIEEPRHLLPTGVADPAGAHVLAALFTPLVGFDQQGQPYEVAAASIEPSHDRRVWTIRLREGFTFHDGEPVTADSYLDAWNYAARQDSGYLFARIEGYGEPAMSGLSKVDDHTFTVTLSEPFGEFRSVLTAAAFYPLPTAAFGDACEPNRSHCEAAGVLREDFGDAPIGNGPFRMAGAWVRGEPIRLERYDGYAGDAPRIGGAEFVAYQEPADAYADLQKSTVDVVTRLPEEQLTTVAAELGDRYLRRPAPGFQFLAFPTHQAELADPDVRRAISMAIDRDHIVETLFGDAQAPARSFVAPVVPGSRVDACGTACQLDPVAARETYARAGGPERLTITYNVDGGHAEWVEETCAQLRANLGVECLTAAEPRLTDLLARVDRRENLGLVRLGWAMDYPSMESYLGPVYSTTGSANFSGYSNPEFDDLVAAGAAAGSPEEAIAAYQRAEDILARDLPVIPLRFGQYTVGHSPAVHGVTISPLGHVDLTRIQAIR